MREQGFYLNGSHAGPFGHFDKAQRVIADFGGRQIQKPSLGASPPEGMDWVVVVRNPWFEAARVVDAFDMKGSWHKPTDYRPQTWIEIETRRLAPGITA